MGHYYTTAGEPAYEVERAKPKILDDGRVLTHRSTTVGDARKLGLVPSVTTIQGVIGKPGLERWKLGEAIQSALTHPGWADYASGVIEEKEFIGLLMVESGEKASEAADWGTRCHAALEIVFTPDGESEVDAEFQVHVEEVWDVVRGIAPIPRWRPEVSFCSPLGYGGKVDLVAVAQGPGDPADGGFVVDFKTQRFKQLKGKLRPSVWPEWCMQLAAYRVGLDLPAADCWNVVIDRDTGFTVARRWEPEELARSWRCFQYLLAYFQTVNQLGPGGEEGGQ
jgi:hypothetical protein